MADAPKQVDLEAVYDAVERAAGIAFAEGFPELRGDVPDEFADAFEAALREYVTLAAAGELAAGPWRSDQPTRLAVYPELRERFEATVRTALQRASECAAGCLGLPAPPAPTERLVVAARNLWSAYLAFNLDPQALH